ncbi:DUF4179 domain-containing protein [Bacillus sp. OK048]|uniref:DUF4179 domain-containing protein n=1 Tax=Bacillus sp. OK048 TaxID=1882761 RepID=UPI00087FA048|nr:DUF4179 domain-containing protein [Bacillus sp. OK048]SDN23094.1 RNA polymerase sigma factor, sigma-70 family [Bacillus sp. OK048]
MIPAKIDPISITPKREKGVESVVEWFEQHKQSFYLLGWSYLSNQQQMEELFYRSILKVHKELPRFKSETSFELWVTSIFIHICRELAGDRSLQSLLESEPRQDFLIALDQLEEYEKEAMVLTYVKGFSREEVAHLLQVSVEKMKEVLFSGIQSLRKALGDGTTFNGCKEYHKDYIDYLERTLDRPKKIDLEKHIYHCQHCQQDLATFQDVMLTMLNLTDRIKDLHMPSGIMENVKAKLAEMEKIKQQRNKKRIRKGLVFAGIFAVLIAIDFFTGAFSNLYYTWTEEDQEVLAYLQQDLGERLNLEAESDGVKIRIKTAIADDVQTLIFYEIEDTNEDNQFMISYGDGVFVENEHEIMSTINYPRFYPPVLETDLNIQEKNVYHGKLSLLPLTKDKGTIKLKITRLLKLIQDSSDQNGFRVNEILGYETGEWNFEIPVTKQASIEYALNEETLVEGIPVRFDKLIIAPTATVLQYGINSKQHEKRIDALNFDDLVVNNKKVKADMYGSSYLDLQQDVNWYTLQTHFGPLVGEKPKEVNVHFASVYVTFEDQKVIELDASRGYPQTFEYAGSTISIDEVEVGMPTTVVISNHDIKKRAYQSLHFNIVGKDENETRSMEMESEAVLVDKNGIEYDMTKHIPYEEIEQPRYFETGYRVKLHGDKVIPKSLNIYGYNTMKYLDDVVKISLD